MTYSYFPGCTLRTKGKELDQWGRAAAEVLGFALEEPENWQCCGAVYPMAKDEIATRLSSVRVLADAKAQGRELVTLCSACHHVIKRVNGDMQRDADICDKVNRYLKLDTPYAGETNVLHYLEVLRDRIGFDALKEKVVHPLTGVKIGAYYGCLLLRPGKEMGFDNPENPRILEDFIRAIGAEPVIYARRNECCGGYCTLENKSYATKQVDKIMDNAKAQGAQMLITACPLCMYNLKENATNGLDVKYFTELLAQALGVKEEAK
ncbi:MAG: CoB--CoM heterodisulfide reductase iron-sulfur subunit B family protein [Oscillospiraceae bacterium]|nr:CoB--CoM heterodisulfide reductase iron-sulfur subunit B family protein [Oscillospiraceae bacterium]